MNPTNLDRRHFLAASATASLALVALPGRLLAAKGEDVVLRFAVMSDVHYSGRPNTPEPGRFKKALAMMNDYSAGQSYPKFDALLVAGDMSDNGTENQIGPFKNDMDAGLKFGTVPVLCMGNHEFWGGSKPLWEKTFGTAANSRTVIGGYHFIALSPEKGNMRNGDYLYALDWLREQLDKAAEDDPKKPIFLIQHYHVSETVYGSLAGDNWGIKDLYELLQEYPRIVDFSGHSHYPITDPRSAWQDRFTAFGTGTLSYFEMEGGRYVKFPPGHRNVGQFHVVEVHRDHGLVVKPYDLITDGFYDTVYLVAEPGNVAEYLYTDARYKTEKRPAWTPDAAVRLDRPDPFGGIFRFPQAGGEDTVHSYRLDFYRDENDKTPEISQYAWSNYFYRNRPGVPDVSVQILQPETPYRLRVTACDCFQKESAETLDLKFTTPGDPEAPEDRDADAPRADVLDLHFTASGITNTPSGARYAAKKPETLGAPKIEADSQGNFHFARFDGKNDAFKILFSEEDYSRLRRGVTMAACFRLGAFSTERNTTDLFANTENGGYCFEINHKRKTLEFWCHIEGRYVIVSAPLTAVEFHTAFGVYDRQRVLLYLDGREVARKDASGLITYPSQAKARAFCVGADITGAGDAASHFEGDIVFARIYGRALETRQIENLSK